MVMAVIIIIITSSMTSIIIILILIATSRNVINAATAICMAVATSTGNCLLCASAIGANRPLTPPFFHCQTLRVLVISLNFLHSDFRHLPSGSLCLQLSPLQENIFSYLRSLIWACFDKEQHARELTCFVSELGLSTFPYPRDSRYGGIVPHSEEGPEALRPYRDVDPSRLKISGEGDWRLQEFLEPELLLPYLEPKTLRSIPRNSIPFALVGKEDPARTEQLLRLWDSRGLLQGRRTFTVIPPGHFLVNLPVPAGKASSDRADFYHQSLISCARAEAISAGPMLTVGQLEGTWTLSEVRRIVTEARSSGASDEAIVARLNEAGLLTATCFVLMIYCSSQAGYILAKTPVPRTGPWQALTIDDFFALCIAAGAQVDSTEITAAWGNFLVSALTGKLLALPAISEELAAGLAGSWIAVLMFRRCLFAVLDGFFSLAK
eukprot:s2453_g4.t1